MTFDEVVAAMDARLGKRVKVQIEERGRKGGRTCQGVLTAGLGIDGESNGHQDDGSVIFRVAPAAWWFRLSPQIFTDAQEEREGRLLRVQMSGLGQFLIETLP